MYTLNVDYVPGVKYFTQNRSWRENKFRYAISIVMRTCWMAQWLSLFFVKKNSRKTFKLSFWVFPFFLGGGGNFFSKCTDLNKKVYVCVASVCLFWIWKDCLFSDNGDKKIFCNLRILEQPSRNFYCKKRTVIKHHSLGTCSPHYLMKLQNTYLQYNAPNRGHFLFVYFRGVVYPIRNPG